MANDHFIVDAHNDLLMEVEFRSGDENPFAATWLGNLRQGGVRLQVCPIGVDLDRIPDGAVDLIEIDHVGLGGDFIRQVGRSGCFRDLAPAEALLPPENYANLVEVLHWRGYEGERLGAILGGNLLRLFRDALP